MALESYYKIAGLNLHIIGGINLCGFSPFRVAHLADVDVEIICDCDNLAVAARELSHFVVDDVSHLFSRYETGYLFTLQKEGRQVTLRYDDGSNVVCVERCDDPQLFRFMLWVAYSLVALGRGVIPIHSSAIVCDESAVLFLGESGAGKSTQSSLWVEHIEGSRLLNDDSPILRFEDGGFKLYGSPWSGKTPCYINECYDVAACVRVVKSDGCTIVQNDTLRSFAAIYPSLPPMFAIGDDLSERMINFVSELISCVPTYTLQSSKAAASAQITHSEIYGKRDNK